MIPIIKFIITNVFARLICQAVKYISVHICRVLGKLLFRMLLVNCNSQTLRNSQKFSITTRNSMSTLNIKSTRPEWTPKNSVSEGFYLTINAVHHRRDVFWKLSHNFSTPFHLFKSIFLAPRRLHSSTHQSSTLFFPDLAPIKRSRMRRLVASVSRKQQIFQIPEPNENSTIHALPPSFVDHRRISKDHRRRWASLIHGSRTPVDRWIAGGNTTVECRSDRRK